MSGNTVVGQSENITQVSGVGNDFFPGGVQGGGFGPRAQGGIRGVDFWTQKLTNFDQNSNFSLF